MSTKRGSWFRCLRPRPDAAVRLVAFPHGGGSASTYRGWHALLPDSVELHAVQYPGHEDRISEPLVGDLDQLVNSVTEAVLPLLDRPFVLYGHSMGAVLAFETALRLERNGRKPALLAVSGHPAPHLAKPGTVHLADEAGLLAELRRLEGVPAEVLDEPLLYEMLLPVVRNDYRIIETYKAGPGVLDAPIVVHRADRDPELTEDEAREWTRVTTAAVEHALFPGGHFHLAQEPEPVVADLVARIGRIAGIG